MRQRLNLSLTEISTERLDRLAKRTNLTRTAMITLLIAEAHERAFPTPRDRPPTRAELRQQREAEAREARNRARTFAVGDSFIHTHQRMGFTVLVTPGEHEPRPSLHWKAVGEATYEYRDGPADYPVVTWDELQAWIAANPPDMNRHVAIIP